MKLVVLGSGTSVPHPKRASAAHWLETDGGSLLLDVGSEAAHRMAQERLDWASLDAIWVSHFHLDHVGGLAPFLFGTKWAPQTQNRRKPLRIYGGKGLRKVLDAVNESQNYELLDQPFDIEPCEVSAGTEFEILPGLQAKTLSTPHTEESLAIRLTNKQGSSLVYTSDTGYDERLVVFAQAPEVLLVECSFHKNKPVNTHLDLADALQMARASGAKRVVLTHLYPEWDEFDVVAEAKALWSGETIEAVDGLRFDF